MTSSVDEGRITDEGIEALRHRIGVEIPREPPWYSVATEDAIRNFAEGYGDINPLWSDPDYARQTRWQGVIAPPMFMLSMGISEAKEIPEELRRRGAGGGLPGVHAFYSGDDIEFYQVIRPGDRLTLRYALADVQVKESAFAGRSVHESYEALYRNQRGEVVGVCHHLIIRTERSAARQRGKYQIEVQRYSDEEMQRIYEWYDREEIRGSVPRFWEDVVVGDELAPVIKGPYTHTSGLRYLMGAGMPPPAARYWVHTHSVMHRYRKKHPGAYPLTLEGFPDSVARVHWDHELARRAGLPAYYDFGAERIAWLAHVVTNWMGDDGFLRRLKARVIRFNYYGDTHWLKGKVTDKTIVDGEYRVELALWAENQRGERTAEGEATVLLPSHAAGPVSLPAKVRPGEVLVFQDSVPEHQRGG